MCCWIIPKNMWFDFSFLWIWSWFSETQCSNMTLVFSTLRKVTFTLWTVFWGLRLSHFARVFYNLFILESPNFLTWLWCHMFMSVPNNIKQIKPMWSDNFGIFFICLSLLFIFNFPLSTASALSSTWQRHKKCQFSSKTTKALIGSLFRLGMANLVLNFIVKKKPKKKKTQLYISIYRLTYPSPEFIPVHQLWTDFIFQIAGTSQNWII